MYVHLSKWSDRAAGRTFGLLTYTVLKAFASRNPCLCRGANAICVGDVFRVANTLATPMW